MRRVDFEANEVALKMICKQINRFPDMKAREIIGNVYLQLETALESVEDVNYAIYAGDKVRQLKEVLDLLEKL